jgi:hypothetical protein
MELVTDADAASEFVVGIIPEGLAEEAGVITQKKNKPELAAVPEVDEESKDAVEIITRRALTNMTQEELANVMRRIEAGEAKLESDPLAT